MIIHAHPRNSMARALVANLYINLNYLNHVPRNCKNQIRLESYYLDTRYWFAEFGHWTFFHFLSIWWCHYLVDNQFELWSFGLGQHYEWVRIESACYMYAFHAGAAHNILFISLNVCFFAGWNNDFCLCFGKNKANCFEFQLAARNWEAFPLNWIFWANQD